MSSDELLILVGMPDFHYDMLGRENVYRLRDAHEEVRVEFFNDPEELNNLAPEADALIIYSPFRHLPSQVLEKDSKLRWVQAVPAGVDVFLKSEIASAEHIALTATKGPMGPMMAEHATALMLALARSIPVFLRSQSEHHWSRTDDNIPKMVQMYGKTIAILGVGHIGSNLARICKVGLGMRVLGMSRTSRGDPNVDLYFDHEGLRERLAESDVIAVCLASTPETVKMIDRDALASMKPTAFLVNVTRGDLIDEEALTEALRSGQIAGVGIDYTMVEPLPENSPLWDLPNVIITPHVAPITDQFGEHVVDFWCENIRRFVEGGPLSGIVNRLQGY